MLAPQPMLHPGIANLVASAFFFSLMSLCVKLAGSRLPSFEMVLARGIVTLVLSYIALKRAGTPLWGNRRGLLVLRGLLGFVGLSSFYYAITELPLADATVIQYTNPVITAVLAAWLLRERIHPLLVAALAMSLGGVVLVAQPGFVFGGVPLLDPMAVGVALLGATASACAYVTVRKLSTSEDSLVIVFYFPFVAVPLTLPFVWSTFLWPTPGEWLLLLGLGITTQIAQVTMTRGLALLPAGPATTIGCLQIVFATFLGWVFFAEIPQGWAVLGAILVICSTVVIAVSYVLAPRARP
ncbi:MAG: DMT family transporter [Myxococcota bacterium]